MTIEEPEAFKVKAGDKLKNGLTVKSVDFCADYNGYVMHSIIGLSGELTLEGILYREPEDGYGVMADDLIFFADSTKYDSIPIAASGYTQFVYYWADTEYEFAMVGDETNISLGNYTYDDISVDLSGIINRGEFVKAKITIKDIRLTFHDSKGGGISATLVSVD